MIYLVLGMGAAIATVVAFIVGFVAGFIFCAHCVGDAIKKAHNQEALRSR